MEPHEDARLRLAASRHPAARAVGSLHLAQLRLDDAARAFTVVMAEAGDPGAGRLPPPGGHGRWPRGHGARQTVGWRLPVPVDAGFECFLDTAARWWMVRLDEQGHAIDAHTVGSPLQAAADLAGFRDGLEQLLADGRVEP